MRTGRTMKKILMLLLLFSITVFAAQDKKLDKGDLFWIKIIASNIKVPVSELTEGKYSNFILDATTMDLMQLSRIEDIKEFESEIKRRKEIDIELEKNRDSEPNQIITLLGMLIYVWFSFALIRERLWNMG